MEGRFTSCCRREEGEEKAKKKNMKYSIPGNTADFMNGKDTFRKENGY
ncbi:hypothetical protein LQK80_34145 [Bacillus thuringiensis]|nr:hypothetical protein [Bacillus thuringiensis]